MNELFRRLRYLINRRSREEELANDMEAHREMASQGSAAPFGNSLRLREEARDAWGWTWMDRFAQDLRYAARMLRRAPGFSLAAILMLAIGIGVNVAGFCFFDLVVLRPLNVRDPGSLLRFHRRSPQAYAFSMPYPEMKFFQDHSRTLSSVLALNVTQLSMEGQDRQIKAHFITDNFLSDLGATASLGRLFDPAGPAGDEPSVVLDHTFWQNRMGADPGVVGKTVRLNGKPAVVIGVASAGFGDLTVDQPDLWAPITQNPYFAGGSNLLTDFSGGGNGVRMWGRLQKGLTPAAAEQELAAITVELRRRYPADIWERESIPSAPAGYLEGAMTNGKGTGREDSKELFPVFAIVGTLALLILAVACGNLGSLLLARGVAREREIMIRVSVGAGRARLIRQLFTESLLLAFMGSIAGLALGYLVLRSLLTLTDSPAWLNPIPDWRVVTFAIAIGFLSAVLFGLTPALQLTRKRERANFMRHFLVAAQVAASCILLIVAGLLVRALDHATHQYPGFKYDQVISIDPRLSSHGYSSARATAWFDTMKRRLSALPGVDSVAVAWAPPLGNTKIVAGLDIDGHHVDVHMNRIDPEFFRTMTIPILRGRNLNRGDSKSIVISESLARRAWPSQDPLGKKFTIDEGYTVVGIAGSANMIAMENSDAVEAYLPVEGGESAMMVLLVKTLGAPDDLAKSVSGIAKTIDPEVFPQIDLLRTSFRRKLRNVENEALVVGISGFIAQLLACFGIVGVVAYAVSQRTREIGLRMALGAKPGNVLSLITRQFSLPVVAGLVMGIAGAAALSRILRQILYGVSNLDPTAYLAAVAVFAITVALAMLLPARRALRVNPMRALRQD